MCLCLSEQRLKHRRLNHVIGVHKADPLSAGHVETGVARIGQAAICLVDDAHATVKRRVLVAYLRAAIERAVVNKDDLKIGMRLGKNAIHTIAQIGFDLVDRHDDSNQRDIPQPRTFATIIMRY